MKEVAVPNGAEMATSRLRVVMSEGAQGSTTPTARETPVGRAQSTGSLGRGQSNKRPPTVNTRSAGDNSLALQSSTYIEKEKKKTKRSERCTYLANLTIQHGRVRLCRQVASSRIPRTPSRTKPTAWPAAPRPSPRVGSDQGEPKGRSTANEMRATDGDQQHAATGR